MLKLILEVRASQLDIQDRATSVTNIEGQVMSIDYGIADFVQQTTRFDGTTITNTYDTAGRKSTITYSSASVPLAAIAYAYYPDGELQSISDGTSTNTYSYDALNQLTNQIVQIGNLQSEIGNQFDPVGNPTNTVVSIGGSQASATSYTYDDAERLTGILHHRGTETQNFSYSYSPINGLVESVSNTVSGITSSYQYDLMDRVANITYKTGNGTLIRGLGYEYDASSMITNKTEFQVSGFKSQVSYTYDSIDRLIHESCSGSVSSAYSVVYNYDLAGNRLSKIEDGLQTTYPLGMGNRLADTNMLYISGTADEPIGTDNRWGELWVSNLTSGATTIPLVNGNRFFAEVTALAGQTNTLKAAIRDRAGNTAYVTKDYWLETSSSTNIINHHAYNAAGCLTNLNAVALEWDERYRLTSVDDASSFVEYTYDVLGRKTTRTEGIDVEHYVYDGNQIVADLDASGNLLRTYVWGTGIDNLLCFTDHATSNTYHAIKDHQNSVIALVDEIGTVVESYEYDAYGNTTVFDASGTLIGGSAIGNRYTFQGREIDWTTGLYYFRARWYNPETGRWLSKDPIGIAGGLNLYTAFENNPVNLIDPMGLYVPAGSFPARVAYEAYDQGPDGYRRAANTTAGVVVGAMAGALTGSGTDGYNQSGDSVKFTFPRQFY
ncbi:MAG: RHS repeat-associated core domain-containing protein [Verrucomicrobia bacterium]|nr:RHS repeat-associated core domain-containing protein [Verrucomicrobiota bacterium]